MPGAGDAAKAFKSVFAVMGLVMLFLAYYGVSKLSAGTYSMEGGKPSWKARIVKYLAIAFAFLVVGWWSGYLPPAVQKSMDAGLQTIAVELKKMF